MPEVVLYENKPLPMLILRGINVFPKMLMSMDLERKSSIGALNEAGRGDRLVFLVAQKDVMAEASDAKDVYSVGVVCRIRQMLQQPGASMCRVTMEGLYRARAEQMTFSSELSTAIVFPLEELKEKIGEVRQEALLRNAVSLYEEYIALTGEFTPEQIMNLFTGSSASYLADIIAYHASFSMEEKQRLLEELRPFRRLTEVCRLLNREINILSIEHELNDAAVDSMNRSQREYYLREEMKAIQSELGEDGSDDEIEEYKKKISALPCSEEIKQKLNKKLQLEGIVFTMYDSRNRLSKEVVENVQQNLEENIYKTIIPRNVRLAEAPSYGMPVIFYAPESTGAEAYRQLALEMVAHEMK